jgi:crossover junction endodeoxyribonuclease RuvC
MSISESVREKVILGMDPGTQVMGYGIIQVGKAGLTLVQFGVIELKKFTSHELRLKRIFERVLNLIDEYKPDEVAIEAPFFGKNVQSMLKLGRAQGVAMAAVLYRGIPIIEYAPRKIKQSVTGKGNASKEQVAKMLMQIFGFPEQPALYDASDALAVALCHHYQGGSKKISRGSWKKFIQENPDRIS